MRKKKIVASNEWNKTLELLTHDIPNGISISSSKYITIREYEVNECVSIESITSVK